MSWLGKILINSVVIRTHKNQMLSTEKHLFHWSFLRVGFILGNFSERETQPIKGQSLLLSSLIFQPSVGQRPTQQHDG